MKSKLITLTACLTLFLGFSQENDSNSANNATVYFVRASGLGALINFTYFDGEEPIGKFNGPKYLKYECSPGEHLFWAKSENKSFVEANLKSGGIYIIDVVPQMGGLKAGVKLVPVDKNNYKLKKIQKLLSKRESETFDETQRTKIKSGETVAKGMERYSKLKEKNSEKIGILSEDMTVNKEDLIFIKKK
ncbi:hypothetical protein ACFSQJ_02565 [Croceitalea marina]|uniref:DUF2846 domain-containing protein n=1 Tax=Croceitalea marina TaxID=1775166 RepID=A0ABW5MTT6_9FLAO